MTIDDIYLENKAAKQALTRKKVELGEAFYKKAEAIRPAFFTALYVAQMNSLTALLKSLAKAAGDGVSFADWKKSLMKGDIIQLDEVERAIAAGGRGYFQTVFRNALMSAYAAGRWHSQQELKDVFPYLMYDAVNDNRTRPTHHALDNKVARVDDPIWHRIYPPNGHNCRCVVRSLTEDEYRQKAATGEAKQFNGDETADEGWNHHGGDPDAFKNATIEAANKAQQGIEEAAGEASSYAIVPAGFFVDTPTMDEAAALGEQLAKQIEKELIALKAASDTDNIEFLAAFDEASKRISEAYRERYLSASLPESTVEFMKRIGLLPRRKANGIIARAVAEGIKNIPAGLAFLFAQAYYRQMNESEPALRGTNIGFFNALPNPSVGVGDNFTLAMDEARGALGEIATHELMHMVQHYTSFDDGLQEFHRLRVLETGETKPRDLSNKNKNIERGTEFYFTHDGDVSTYHGAYMYKASPLRQGEQRPKIETARFLELVAVLNDTLVYPQSKPPLATIEILSDTQLMARYFGLLEWSTRKLKQLNDK